MADDVPITGAGAYIQYGWEAADTYGTEANTIDKAFGHDQRITSWNRNHGSLRIYELGNPDAVKAAAGKFAGSITIEFILASSYFLKAVMGKVGDTPGAPDTHVYAYNSAPAYAVTSETIEVGLNLDTDNVYKLLGCVVRTCEISAVVGEPIRVSLTFDYADETKATSGLDSDWADDAEEPFEFAHASLEIPNATGVNRVQNFIMTIQRNPEITYGLGYRTGQKAVWKASRWDWRMTVAEEHDDWIEDAYGQATGPLTSTSPGGNATLELTITNSRTGDDLRSLVILMGKSYFEADSMAIDVGSVVFHDWSGYCLGPTTITGSDATAATP